MPEAVIEAVDWEAAAALVVPFAYDDEHLAPGYVHLVVAGGTATWSARDEARFATVQTTNVEGAVDALIPPRIVEAGAEMARRSGSAWVRTDPEDSALTIGDGTSQIRLDLPELQPPNVADLLAHARDQPSVAATLPLAELRLVVAAAGTLPSCNQRSEEFDVPLLWLEVAPDAFSLSVQWEGLGPASYSIAARAQGSARVAVDPRHLREFCAVVDGDEIHLEVPTDANGTLLLHARNWTGGTTPVKTGAESFRPAVEQALASLFGPAALRRDHDGDYYLPRSDTPVYGRLADNPPCLQIFAIALDGVEQSPELFEEINGLNTRASLVRVVWVADQVLVEGEIPADSVEPATIFSVLRSVDDVASEAAPLLAAMFGGTAGPDSPLGREWLWQRYAETIVAVETEPGEWLDLNGPNAVARMPLRSPIHILSAWNPGGVTGRKEANEEATARLVGELWNRGVGFLRACGRGPDATEGEHSGVAVSGLDREAARELAASYGQDSIFELDDTSIMLVSSRSRRVSTVSRFDPVGLRAR